MFISLHGLNSTRLIVNLNHVRAFQEITNESKYKNLLESGAKTVIQIDDKLVPIKDSIVQIKNIISKVQD